MEKDTEKKRKVTLAQAVKVLEKQGIKMDEKEVEKVLEIMYFLAKLIVNQKFKL